MLLRSGTNLDIRAIAYLSALAFIDDPVEAYLYPRRRESPDLFVDAQEDLIRRNFDRPCGSAIVITLEPSDEGWTGNPDIVGFCILAREGTKWQRPLTYNKKKKKPAKDAQEPSEDSDAEPTCPMIDPAHSKAMDDTYREKDSMAFTEEGFKLPHNRYELCDLGVHPEFRGRGVAKTMVKWVQEKAREEGLPVHTTSTPDGQGLYQRMGFRKVGRWKWCPVPGTEWDVMHWNPPDTLQK